jgi:molecular chaperone GrpE
MTDETDLDLPETDETPEATIARLEAEIAEWKDQAMRHAAEAENTRRRTEREMNDARAYAIQRFATSLLGVADNLGRALQHAPRDHEDAAVKNLVLGIDMTEKALQDAFAANGLKKVEPGKGDKFDPNKHQAMMEQDAADVPGGGVVSVVQPGYELFGRVVRPAMVVVAARPAPKAAPAAANDGHDNPYAHQPQDDFGGTVDTKA